MNPEAQAFLDAILKKNPEELNSEEKGFLRARRSYLKKSQLDEYESVLEEKKTKPLITETVKKHARTTK